MLYFRGGMRIRDPHQFLPPKLPPRKRKVAPVGAGRRLALIATKPRRYFALSDISTSALARLPRLARAVITNPAECVTRAISAVRELPERSQPPCPYVVDSKWEEELHNCLGRKSACGSGSELQAIWPDVLGTLAARGVTAGPMSYLGWNDGDPEFVRAIWCLVRHLGAQRVVETGVAHGVTSRFVLEALARNGGGHLWSIDLPPPAHPELHWQIGIAVHQHLREHWTYIAGPSASDTRAEEGGNYRFVCPR